MVILHRDQVILHRNFARIPPSHLPPPPLPHVQWQVAATHTLRAMVVSSRHRPCTGHAH